MSNGAPSGDISAAALFALVRDAVALVCEVEPTVVTRDTRLTEDLAADSLALVETVEVCEESLRSLGSDLTFADEELDGLLSVGDLVDYLVDRQSTTPAGSMAPV